MDPKIIISILCILIIIGISAMVSMESRNDTVYVIANVLVSIFAVVLIMNVCSSGDTMSLSF